MQGVAGKHTLLLLALEMLTWHLDAMWAEALEEEPVALEEVRTNSFLQTVHSFTYMHFTVA